MPQTGRVSERYPGRPEWRRVSLGRGHVLDLLYARVAQAFAPHVHEAFALGACTDGLEVISYRGGLHYAGPGSVVILEPGEPRFPEPVVMDPELAWGLRRVHAGLSQDPEPLEAESRLSWLLGELVRRHASPAPEVAALAGFADQAHLTRWFRRVVGVTPGAYAASVWPGGR